MLGSFAAVMETVSPSQPSPWVSQRMSTCFTSGTRWACKAGRSAIGTPFWGSADPGKLRPGRQVHDPRASHDGIENHHPRLVLDDLADERGVLPGRFRP